MRARASAWSALLLVFSVAGTAAAQEKAGWRSLMSDRQLAAVFGGGEIHAVEFLNHNVGYAVGGKGAATLILRTTDGGTSWQRNTGFDGEQHKPNFTDIGFADANNGWIVGTEHILRTSDGGESWEPVDYGQSRPWATSLLVLGPDAIIIGTNVESKQIARTVDGGRSWEQIELYDHSNTQVSGLAWSASNSAVFASVGRQHGSYGAIQRSNDGGRTWEIIEETDKPILDINFAGKTGVAVGQNIAFWTNDGGETWKRVILPGWMHAVDVVNENLVVAVGARPFAVFSTNGGKSWRPISPPQLGPSGTLEDVFAVDPGWIFVAGGYGAKCILQFVDPTHLEPIHTAELGIPVDIRVGDEVLPRGEYEITLGHQGDEHVLVLEREGALPAGTDVPDALEKDVQAQNGQQAPPCADPCGAAVPVEVTYEKQDLPEGKAAQPGVNISLQPTETGIAVVIDAVVSPPRQLAVALAGAGIESGAVADTKAMKEKAKKGGGLFDRIKKAASGDLKGATAGASPAAAQQRMRAAKASPAAVYEISVRHPIRIFRRNAAGSN